MPETLPPDGPQPEVVLDAARLRGIAHPLRVRLLGLLRAHGPSTATRLAARVGESSAATSYHLRQLATYGFVVPADPPEAEAGRPGAGREKWWRAAHRSTRFDSAAAQRAATPEEREEVDVLAGEYLRSVATVNAAKVDEWLRRSSELPPRWQGVGTLSDTRVRLTPEQADELAARVSELVRSYGREDLDAAPAPGSVEVVVQWQVLPQPEDGDPANDPADDPADDDPEEDQ